MVTLAEAIGGKQRIIGGPFGSKLTQRDYCEKGVPVIRGGNMGGNGRWIGGPFAYVSEEKFRLDLAPNAARPGDIIVTQRGTLGQVAIIADDTPHPTYVVSQSQMAVNVDNRLADRDFVYYFLTSPIFTQFIEVATIQTGVPHINLGLLRNVEVNWPARNDQRRIASILGALDDKIELNRRMNETLEAMARAIFQDWFVAFGPTRAKMEGRPPYLAPYLWALFPDRLDAEGKPEGWATSSLKVIADQHAASSIRTGPFGSQLHQSDYTPQGVPVVMPTNLTSGEIVADDIARVAPNTAARLLDHRLEPGDIVYGRRGDIGRKALVADDQDGWLCGTGCLKLRIRSSACPPLFLFHYLDLPTTRDWIAARAVGATMPNLNTSIMGEVEVLQPGVAMCAAFENFARPLRARSTAIRLESETLAATRDLLLPRLMSGELRVKDAERAIEEAA